MNHKRTEAAIFSVSYIAIFLVMQGILSVVLVIWTYVVQKSDTLKMEDVYLFTAIADIMSVFLMFLIIHLRKVPLGGFATHSKARVMPLLMAVVGGFAISGLINLALGYLSGLSYFKTIFDTYSNQFASLDIKNNLALYAVTIWLLIPICEELVFRGFLFGDLKRIFPVNYAILIQAVLFGLIHMNLVQSSYTFLAALFFGYAYQKTGKIIVPILMHMLFNIIGTSLGYVGNDNAVLVITLSGIPLFILSLAYFKTRKHEPEAIYQ